MAPTSRKIVKMDFFRKGNNYVSPRDNWREENNYGASSTWYLFYSFLFLFFFFFSREDTRCLRNFRGV